MQQFMYTKNGSSLLSSLREEIHQQQRQEKSVSGSPNRDFSFVSVQAIEESCFSRGSFTKLRTIRVIRQYEGVHRLDSI